MCTKKEVIIFFAGAEAFHTFAHLMLTVSGLLPLHPHWLPFAITPQFNAFALAFNALITIGLLYWASRIRK